MKKILLAVAFLFALSSPAWAGGSAGSFGVGAEYTSLGVGGVSVNYDGGAFHAGGFLGYYDGGTFGNNNDVEFGGRFYYHIHSTSMSDFGLGGQLGLRTYDNPAPADNFLGVYIDLGAQVRVFLSSNVALSAGLGLTIASGDADGVALTGDPVGTLGFHYYFF